LPREVFFGRLGLVGVFFVWACDFGRFFPATSGSFFGVGSLAHPSGQGLRFGCDSARAALMQASTRAQDLEAIRGASATKVCS
jgi:hypothetical protein